MYKKRALILWCYLSLLALAACWPKVIDNWDLVTVSYKYTLDNWTIVDQWNKELTIWDTNNPERIESIIRWAKQNDEFEWKINWKEIYKNEYDSDKVRSFANIILTEVMWLDEPKVWTEINVNSIWTWIITSIEKDDEEWYDNYVVNFNDPKTYSELSYSLKIINIDKK